LCEPGCPRPWCVQIRHASRSTQQHSPPHQQAYTGRRPRMQQPAHPCACSCSPPLLAGPDMSALGMLAAMNKARRTALPPTADSPGAAEWRLIEAATPLTVTALRAAAATGDTGTVVAALQQQMQPIQPTPLMAQQVCCGARTCCCWPWHDMNRWRCCCVPCLGV
jgi:hypothetical protein